MIAGKATDRSIGVPQQGRKANWAMSIVKDFPQYACATEKVGLDTRLFQ